MEQSKMSYKEDYCESCGTINNCRCECGCRNGLKNNQWKCYYCYEINELRQDIKELESRQTGEK